MQYLYGNICYQVIADYIYKSSKAGPKQIDICYRDIVRGSSCIIFQGAVNMPVEYDGKIEKRVC